ncbi:hypothetical protein NS2_20930 [Nocardia seriolae NBRC 15557]|nr:hypothetical protein NS2_20930 [Nocardia seriolae NBRC 15557]
MVTVSSGVSSAVLARIVASVGPYPFTNRRDRPPASEIAQRRTSSGGHASPATTSSSKASSPLGSTEVNADGVIIMWFTRSRRSSAANSGPPYTVGAVTTNVAAAPTASSSSPTYTSNDGEITCSTRESEVAPRRSRWTAQ